MHTGQLLGNQMLRTVLLLCQPFDPPDLEKELADLFCYAPAVLIGHEITIYCFPDAKCADEILSCVLGIAIVIGVLRKLVNWRRTADYAAWHKMVIGYRR
jgi:hypothetical protein